MDLGDRHRRSWAKVHGVGRSSAWWIGLLSHLLNSVLLCWSGRLIVQPNLGSIACWRTGVGGVLACPCWGLVSPLSGIGFMD